jgi:hypothetical protein
LGSREEGTLTEGGEIFATVSGARELVDWFGNVPRFHDAEILDLHLSRSGASLLRVHTWQMTSEVDEKGYFRLEKHVVVTFAMEEITGLNLRGFNHQNVIDGLEIKRYGSGGDFSEAAFRAQFPPGPEDFGVILEPTYGVGGVILARQLRISFVIGEPKLT